MNFEKLLAENKIGKIEPKEFELSLTERDIKAAKDSYNAGDYDWALSIAYNAVLQVSRSLMFYLGYRPKGENQHKIVFEFLTSSGFDSELVSYFDAIRKTRHLAIYDRAGVVSRETAGAVIPKVETFVQKMRTFVRKIGTATKKNINDDLLLR